MPRRLRITIILVLAVVAAGLTVIWGRGDRPGQDQANAEWATCTSEAIGGATVVPPTSPPPPVELTEVAALKAPTALTTRPDDPGIYVGTRAGTISRLEAGSIEELIELGPLELAKEQGLGGLAFSPDGNHLYVGYTINDGTSVVEAFEINAAGTVAGEGLRIFELEQPSGNHNVGNIAFGPDGYLYIASGDGGSDEFEPDIRRDGQDLSTLYGAILRIEPDPVAGGYAVPDDNPFVADDVAQDEIWVYGLRNPWRFSFDSGSGDLWIGDVGQYCWEEINTVDFSEAEGANFGWSAFEGFHTAIDDLPAEHVLPAYAYARTEADDDGVAHCAVIGGHVYRGTAIPDLEGTYVFGDWCTGRLETLTLNDDGSVRTDVLAEGLIGTQALAADSDGELYVLDSTGVYRVDPTG